MNVCDFTNKLIRIFEKYENIDNINSIDQINNRLCEEFEEFKSIIPDFFSKNGEANNIKRIYKLISTTNIAHKYISCIDTINAMMKYNEYYRGMNDFIEEITIACNMNKDINNNHYNELLNQAEDKDKKFIESVLGGELNPKQDMELEEAIRCIEVLIDFLPQISSIQKKSIDIINNIDNKETNSNPILIGSIKLLYKSVSYYCYKMIVSIFEIYDDINNKIDNNEKNTNNENFKLF